MKRSTKFISILVVTAFLLLACQVSGVTTPAAGPANAPTATPTVEPLTYVNQESGVRVHYPRGWNTQAPAQGDQALTGFVSPDQTVSSYLYAFPAQASDTPESAIADLSSSALTGLTDVQIVSDAALSRADGTPAWSRVVTAKSNGTEMKINMTTAIYGTRLFFMLTFGSPSAYDYYANDVAALLNGMVFESPVVNGVNRSQALFLSGGESTNPRDYDPATEHSSGDKLVFSGLVSFNTSLYLVPELAESWDISADGTVYTFYLRTNARFHDGRAVVAQDVIYSWERAANLATQSDTVLTYLGDIVGAAEMHDGTADHISGLEALDDHTLQVTIDAAKPYFLFKLTMPVAFVLDQKNVESGSEWYRTPNGTGPYKLTRWDSFQLMVYDANQDYTLGPPSIPQIVVKLYSGIGIRLYESGEIDMTGVYSSDVARVLDPADPLHADLYSGVSLCTDYVVFDVTQPPFEDVKVRQAFTMAFDRQKYIDVVNNGVGILAKGPYPPALPGYNLDLQGLPYDPEQARQLLAESKYGGPQGLPPIIFTDAGIGNTAGASVAAMAQMWQQNLGVTITIENLEPDKYYDLLYSGQHGQLFSGGWCADYPDPENFADVLFNTSAQQNIGNYSNPALDAVLGQARLEQDVTKRIQLYQQAEQIIVQDAPALFIMHGVSYELVRPNVKGFVLTPINIPLERYLWLQP
ncbi:MAG: peptide ABC transporter substrate-binding protein [Chloroflexi bacterium]|nr:peptide ABC transporter substrate-binding protein [Chloroflexota bacterium]